ncbi:MAG: Hsp20/alpha crystallin family protein, partial [Dehalococcoidia bacterium]
MSIIRWEPLPSLFGLSRVMDRFFEDPFGPPVWRAFRDGHSIPLDVYQTEDALIVKATIPGLKPDEVEITIEGDSLSIRGEVKTEEAS